MDDKPRLPEPVEIGGAKSSGPTALALAVFKRLSVPLRPGGNRGERLVVRLLLMLVVLVAVAVTAHLIWSHGHVRPNLQLTDDLRVVTTSPNAAATGLLGYRITAANGQPVNTIDQYDEVTGAGSGRMLVTDAVLEAERGVTKRTFWRESRVALHFELDANGVILGVAPQLQGGPDVVGARLIAIGGTPLSELADPPRALQRNQSTLRLTLALPDAATFLDLVIVRLDWRVQYALLMIGVVFGVLGFTVYRLKPNSASSWGFLAFCVVVATFWMLRSVPQFYRVPLERTGFYLLQCSLPLATLFFLGTFSPLRVLFTSLRPWLVGAAALGVMLLGVNQITYPRDAAAGILSLPLLVGLSVIMLAIVLLSQQTRLWFHLRGLPIGQTDQARATALRFAALLGFVPLGVFYPAVAAQRIDFSLRLWFELMVLAFPLIVSYAIVRHNLLQLNELGREGLAVGLLVLLLGLANSAAAASVGPLARRVIGEAGGGLSQALAVGALAFVLMPLYAATRRRLLHRYHRADSLDEYLHALTALADRQRNLNTFCDEAVLISSSALNGTVVTLLLRRGSPPGIWQLAASTADTKSSLDVERCRPLLQLLVQTNVTLDQNEILEGRSYRTQRGVLLKAWAGLNTSMLLPLCCGDRQVGALVLGTKPGGTAFTAQELRFIEGLRACVAIGLGRWFTMAHGATTPTAPYPAYPATIGRYRVDRLLGEGATCYVYLGIDGDREVAIKVPKPKTLSSDTLLERFLRESRTMRRVTHPHVVQVLDEDTTRGEPFIVVEYFPEGSFNRYLKRVRSLDEAKALSLIRDLASGLEAALERGIIHRDIKPANFFLAVGEQVKVGDFGLAKVVDETTLTEPGSVLGTPTYISPEVAKGLEASWKSDQYSLGICLFEMLAGEPPFKAESLDGLLYLHVIEPIPDLCQRRGISPGTQGILRRMTEKTPEHRFQSYAQLQAALQMAIGSLGLVA